MKTSAEFNPADVFYANHAFMDTTKTLTASQLDYIYSVYVAQNG
jgi:hypothetical protein